ncbi:TetR/AcrR family transcriptional regulator [Devosia sp. CN2-171]|uniref:TetR/AcrR family transcriptional regulator n=1 Tax=Devosia sp. CN2-171 TaxID=3400909 RepID=UPI003BF7B2C3
MSRPKKIPDEDIVEAVAELLGREGPAGLTFAAASAATGLSPATLVQRYGNREALMRAALLWMWDIVDRQTAEADATQPIDPDGAIALLVRLSAGYGSGDEAAQGLLLLREDFRDPVLRARGVAWHKALATALGRRLSTDPETQARLGQLMAAQWQGIVLWWGFSREGTLRGHLRRELHAWMESLRSA